MRCTFKNEDPTVIGLLAMNYIWNGININFSNAILTDKSFLLHGLFEDNLIYSWIAYALLNIKVNVTQ